MDSSSRDPISFPRFFNATELGKSLKEVSTDLLATRHKDIISRWFHSANDADLFIWMDTDRNIIKQQLSFYGQVVEWNLIEGVKTGLIVEDNRAGISQSEVVRFDAKPQSGPIRQAVELLLHVAALTESERQALVDNLQNLNSSTVMSPEMFVERFGAFLGEEQALPRAVPVSLWSRIKSWLFGPRK